MWECVDGVHSPAEALFQLRQALANGATVDCMRKADFNTPLRTLLSGPAKGKADLAKALVDAGSNPLRAGVMEIALFAGEAATLTVLARSCVERGYTTPKGKSLLEYLVHEAPLSEAAVDTLEQALSLGAYHPAPEGTTWLHMLLSRPSLQKMDPVSGQSIAPIVWQACKALLETGVDPNELDQHGVSVGELAADAMRGGFPPPGDQQLLRRLLAGRLDETTPHVTRTAKPIRV